MESRNPESSSLSSFSAGYAVPRDRVEDLLSLYEKTTCLIDPEDVYQKMVDMIALTLDCEGVNMYLLTISGDLLTEYATRGNADIPSEKGVRQLPITLGRVQWMIETRQPILMDFVNPHQEDVIPEYAAGMGFTNAASIPLVAGDEMLGMYCLSFREHQDWTDENVDYYMMIGRLLGASAKQTQMMKKTVELQTIVERKRLSAEIHDNLSQLVSLMKIGAETAIMSYEEGDDEAVQKDLERLGVTSQEALKVLREEILYLRNSVNQAEGLVSSVAECLERFNQQWNIGAKLQVKKISEAVAVSVQAELQLTRILHESLSNILRHAGAKQVLVTLEEDDKRLFMRISDDGCGFDQQAVPPERLGIRIMQERADSIGGKVAIQSVQNQGTVVIVDIPLLAW